MEKQVKYPIFSAKLNVSLQQKGVSQYKLAEQTPLKGPNIYRIATGERRPTDEFLAALARYEALGITLQELQAWRNEDEFPDLSLERLKAIKGIVQSFRAELGDDPIFHVFAERLKQL